MKQKDVSETWKIYKTQKEEKSFCFGNYNRENVCMCVCVNPYNIFSKIGSILDIYVECVLFPDNYNELLIKNFYLMVYLCNYTNIYLNKPLGITNRLEIPKIRIQ